MKGYSKVSIVGILVVVLVLLVSNVQGLDALEDLQLTMIGTNLGENIYQSKDGRLFSGSGGVFGEQIEEITVCGLVPEEDCDPKVYSLEKDPTVKIGDLKNL